MFFPIRVPEKRVQKKTQALLCTLTHESTDMIFFPEKAFANKNLSFHSFITPSFLCGHIIACKLQPDILILNMLKGFLWSTLHLRLPGSMFSACLQVRAGSVFCEIRVWVEEKSMSLSYSSYLSTGVLIPYHSELEPKNQISF